MCRSRSRGACGRYGLFRRVSGNSFEHRSLDLTRLIGERTTGETD